MEPFSLLTTEHVCIMTPTPEQPLHIFPDVMSAECRRVLHNNGFSSERAEQLAAIITTNTLEGVATHGIDRLARFVRHVREGFVKPDAEPSLVQAVGGLERWNGNLGPGPLNALFCTQRAEDLALVHGIGCVALANTSHWLRGGTYAWKAAADGFAFIGWTNTIGNMPAWGAKDRRIGNNPLVIGMPFGESAVVLDMSMSQYSYGAMDAAVRRGDSLPFPGGYDEAGMLTHDPAAILKSHRPLPVGYWKGSSAALLLDILAAIVSGGSSTIDISAQGHEYGVSQIFICIDLHPLGPQEHIVSLVQRVIDDLHSSLPVDEEERVRYPGERTFRLREENRIHGIPVDPTVWKTILAL